MKYRLPRPILDAPTYEVISRKIREQEFAVTRASAKRLQEIAAVTRVIERQGLPDNFVCKKLPYKLGHGIFLARDAKPIRRYDLIAPYTGEVSIGPEYAPDDSAYAFALITHFHLTKLEQAYFDPKNRYHPRRLYSVKLDALKTGNFTRFINHSSHPNVMACMFSIPKHNRYGLVPSPMEIIYLAKKTIHPGEQLLVCYEEEEGSYWDPLGIKPFSMDPRTFEI